MKYCDYYNIDFINKYNVLSYNDMLTEIVGNTFYIYTYKINYWHKRVRQNICIIPMIKLQEETLRDVLRAWGFDNKYLWLNEPMK